MRFHVKKAGLSAALTAPAVVVLLTAVPVQAQAGSPCDSETVVPAGQDALRADCEALWDFYNQLDDPGVLDDAGDSQWGSSNALSSWRGVTVSPPGRVTALNLSGGSDLSGSGLVGPISPALGRLTGMVDLNLGGNALTGPIPAELGQLVDLWRLSLWRNDLTGPIPTSLSRLTNLSHLALDNNQLSGPIPSELGSLTGLTHLDLSGNDLTGSIPVELSQLTALKALVLWGNELTGPIPSELGQLKELTQLYLVNNVLSGPIPVELGWLTDLTHLELGGNDLTGSIPAELGELNELTRLSLANNDLSGSIPVELGKLSNLNELYLWGNQLSGSIPVEFGQLTELRMLFFSDNMLEGSIPAEFEKLANLVRVDLNNNKLSGQIPSQLGQLTKLTYLNLSFNELTGPIPPELENLTGLTFLELSGNRLERHLPPGLSRFGPFPQANPEPFQSDPLRLIAYSEVHQEFTLGDKVWDVWFCDTPNGNVAVDQGETMKLLNTDIAQYFHWLSNDRYRPAFDNAGLIQGPDLAGCEKGIRARRQETTSSNRFMVIDDTDIFTGIAAGAWWDPSTVSVAAGAVSVVRVGGWPEAVHAIITHEIGHALGFPHAFGGLIRWADGRVYEGDNPMDAVTGNTALGATTGTIAVNRYAAGWIDPKNVAIHPNGKSHTYELKALGSSGTQMLVLPDPRLGVMATLGARVATGYDSTIPKEGIEVYRVDQTRNACKQPFGNMCWALLRRTQPFPPAELSHGTGDDLDDQRKAELTQHVHSVGDVFEVGTASVEILERMGDSFRVRVVDSAEPTYAGRFSDEDGSAHEDNIEAIAGRGVTLGCSPTYPGLFCPGRVVTRAQMMAFLARALGEEGDAAATTSRFGDVPASAWYLSYLERLADLGVVEPYEDGTFRPSEPLTRRDMAIFLTRAFSHISPVAEPAGAFEDVPADAPYAAEVEAILAAGVTRGCSAEPMLYCPEESVTRAQMASFLTRALQDAPN